MNVTEMLNSTLGNTSVGVTVPQFSNGLTFGEDGVRQPPSFTASNNVIIMVLGLGLLIVPVAGFLICMCAKSRVLKTLRGMQFMSDPGEGSGLPYSQFDSEHEDLEQNSGNQTRKAVKVPGAKNKDVRVLVSNDNTFTGTPSKKVGNKDALLRATTNSGLKNAPLNDDYATLDVDATFIVPTPINASLPSSESGSTVPNYPYSYT